ncbi:MAG: MGMT family protein [Verrucomicrobiota bacterium]
MQSREITPFQKSVYDATSLIPKGSVTTYKLLGQMVGCRSPRAIGQALRLNPFAPEVPCHRVVKTDLSLGGYMGQESPSPELKKKKHLLALEGVRFIEKNRINPQDLWTPTMH